MSLLGEVPLFEEQAWSCLIDEGPTSMLEFHADYGQDSPHMRFFEGNTIEKLTSGQRALLFSALGNNVPNAVEGDAQVTFLGRLRALVRVMKGDLILLFFAHSNSHLSSSDVVLQQQRVKSNVENLACSCWHPPRCPRIFVSGCVAFRLYNICQSRKTDCVLIRRS
jgi:hypothetical protein